MQPALCTPTLKPNELLLSPCTFAPTAAGPSPVLLPASLTPLLPALGPIHALDALSISMPPALFTQELHPAPQPLLSVSRSLWDEASTPRKRKAPEQSCVLKDIAGSSCHQCKSRRSHDELHFCRSFALADSKDDERNSCKKKYCGICLNKFYREQPPSKKAKLKWTCPACRDICCCAACRRSKAKQGIFLEKPSSSLSNASKDNRPKIQKVVTLSPATSIAVGIVLFGDLLDPNDKFMLDLSEFSPRATESPPESRCLSEETSLHVELDICSDSNQESDFEVDDSLPDEVEFVVVEEDEDRRENSEDDELDSSDAESGISGGISQVVDSFMSRTLPMCSF